MRCPFLREAQVKFCHASAYRKMILRVSADAPAGERCSSGDYIHCSAMREFREETPNRVHCPFLQESLVQYCTASPVTKYVPYSESTLTKCGNENHRYCELYLSLRYPVSGESFHGEDENRLKEPGELKEYSVEGMMIPGWLWYSANHMWLNIGSDGHLHVGIDDFLAKVLGHVDQINYITLKGEERPTVVLTVAGVDLHLVFPVPFCVTGTNSYLRANPQKLTSDPYTLGWLFEGLESQCSRRSLREDRSNGHLIGGVEAEQWMQKEVHRFSLSIHELAANSSQGNLGRVMQDGGNFSPGVLRLLRREEILRLFDKFFPPYPSMGKLL